MRAAEKIGSIRKNERTTGCALPRMKALLLDEAVRGAGRSLHELLAIAELMRVAYEKGELESLYHRLSSLMEGAECLSSRLSNMLLLSQFAVNTPASATNRFDITLLLKDVVQTARTAAGDKKISIVHAWSPGLEIVNSDSQKIHRIMAELVGNAVKFTERGRIALIASQEKYLLRLVVTDTGKGMSKDEMACYFCKPQSEFQGASLNETEGVGLRIVKHLVDSLGARLSVSSRINEGTVVEVSIPLSSPASEIDQACRTKDLAPA